MALAVEGITRLWALAQSLRDGVYLDAGAEQFLPYANWRVAYAPPRKCHGGDRHCSPAS